MEFDEHEEQEEEMGIQVSASYESLGNNAGRPKMATAGVGGGEGASSTARKGGGVRGVVTCRYRECLKNHAVNIGGHAVDGCGEFMAAGEEGTIDALKCAACNCHRNFHRKEMEGESFQQHHPHHHHAQFSPYYRTPPAGYFHLTPTVGHRPLALPATSAGGGAHSREEQEDMSNPSSSGGGSGSKKRFRTKFTQEQKEKMLGFAEKVGWRIQKHDEAAVQQFCTETNVKRHVLKVWMHNNKHNSGKKP